MIFFESNFEIVDILYQTIHPFFVLAHLAIPCYPESCLQLAAIEDPLTNIEGSAAFGQQILS